MWTLGGNNKQQRSSVIRVLKHSNIPNFPGIFQKFLKNFQNSASVPASGVGVPAFQIFRDFWIFSKISKIFQNSALVPANGVAVPAFQIFRDFWIFSKISKNFQNSASVPANGVAVPPVGHFAAGVHQGVVSVLVAKDHSHLISRARRRGGHG